MTEKKRSAYQIAMKELEETFIEARFCDPPDWEGDPKACNKLWSAPLNTIWRKCNEDTAEAKDVVRTAVERMVRDKLTLVTPKQVLTVAESIILDRRMHNAHNPHQLIQI